jgi:hypothetical protein
MIDLRDGGRPAGGHGPTTRGPQQLRTRQAAAPGAVALLRRLELHPALHRELSPCSVDWSSTPPCPPPFLLHRRGRSSTPPPVLEEEEPSSLSRCSARRRVRAPPSERRPRYQPPPLSGSCASVFAPPLPPASDPSAVEPTWGGRHPEQRKSHRGGAGTLLRAGFGSRGSSSTVPTFALCRADLRPPSCRPPRRRLADPPQEGRSAAARPAGRRWGRVWMV